MNKSTGLTSDASQSGSKSMSAVIHVIDVFQVRTSWACALAVIDFQVG